MPISAAKISEPSNDRPWPSSALSAHRNSSGFTLLEIGLVVLIIGILVTVLVPRLRDPGRSTLLAQAHKLALTFKLLRNEAVLNGATYRLNYDIEQQRYWVSPGDQTVDLQDFASQIGLLAHGTKIPSPVGIIDVVLPTLSGKSAQGQVFTSFYPDGSVDPTVIHIGTRREALTLWLSPGSGKLNMDAGYRDVEYSG